MGFRVIAPHEILGVADSHFDVLTLEPAKQIHVVPTSILHDIAGVFSLVTTSSRLRQMRHDQYIGDTLEILIPLVPGDQNVYGIGVGNVLAEI